jgi:hypothetical protein
MRNSCFVTPTLSVAEATTVTVPLIVEPFVGVDIAVNGPMLSTTIGTTALRLELPTRSMANTRVSREGLNPRLPPEMA